MYNLPQYQKEQVCLLALYHPYPIVTVEYVFVMCGKSFDKTEKALKLGSAYNSLERGINEANGATASTDTFGLEYKNRKEIKINLALKLITTALTKIMTSLFRKHTK